MLTLKAFNYLTPQTLAEATSLLARYKDEAKVIAGGTDLVPLMKERVITPKYLIDIKQISSLDYIKWDEKEGLSIGALTKIYEILNSDIIKEKYFSLHQAAESFGTTQVRNMATIGGNICRSSPSADTVPPLLVFDARVKLVTPEGERKETYITGPGEAAIKSDAQMKSAKPKGERTVPLESFFTGPGENVLTNEILTEIQVPPPPRPCGTAFKKLARTAEDLAKVNCAVRIVVTNGKCKDIRIALGAVAPTPVRARKVEQALIGKEINPRVIEEAAVKVAEDIAPMTDVRSNTEYRTYISQILVKRLIHEAIERLGEK